MGLDPRFLSGRIPPEGFSLNSPQIRDFYDEHLYYAHVGRTINGTRVTGDHMWFLNQQPLELFYKDPLSGKKIQEWGYGHFSQTDDWIFKQLEEADQADMASAMMTGRGLGKTYIVLSVGSKTYYLNKGAHCIISAAIDDHANPSFTKMKQMIVELEKKHPALGLKLIKNDDDMIEAGEVKIIDGIKTKIVTSKFEKIVYGNSPGKSKGRRVRYQQFEEWGDWSCAAKLIDCIESSQGTWKVGDVYLSRVFYTGTGGTVKSDQAREVFFNPRAYNIYPVKPYDPKTSISVLLPEYLPGEGVEMGIFLPSIVKRGGFYEFERTDAEGNVLFSAGEDDLAGALKSIMDERESKKDATQALDKLTQEYPITVDEVFRQGGNGVFDRPALGRQKQYLKMGKVTMPAPYPLPDNYEHRTKPETGKLEWVFEFGKKKGVRWIPDPNGLIMIAEHPPMDANGRLVPIENAYIAGLDSIDQGKDDSMGTTGSKIALAVKKRQGGVQKTSNFYACMYSERPDNPDDAFDNVLKILWYYSCQVNLEYTKISIRSYFSQRGEFWRFIRRPRIFTGNVDDEKASNLIGTHIDGAGFVLGHGIRRLKAWMREFMHLFYFDEAIQQCIDYTLAMKTKFDYVMAMILAEIADEELANVAPEILKEPDPIELPVHYQDPETGYMMWGVPQHGTQLDLLRGARAAARTRGAPDLVDAEDNPITLRPLMYGQDFDGTPHMIRAAD